jgi:16S rRNA (cytosine967-C5)-methyltransferase
MPRRVDRPASDARAVALEVLLRVLTTDAFADALLAHRLEAERLEPADRRLATELVYGTLTWQARLDHHLQALLHGPLAALEPRVLVALRLGLYQLLFLDRVPAYAAVDASVRLSGPPRHGARGLVNAVLRRATRMARSDFALPERGGDPIDRLALEWSHPRWLVERWTQETAAGELPRLLEAENGPAPTVLRTNVRRTTRDRLCEELRAAGIAVRPGAHATSAIVVEHGADRLRGLAAYREGRFAFQGEASQLVASLVEAPSGGRVLDACAGRGGKTLALAERLPDARIVAIDPRATGLRRIKAEARRCALPNVPSAAADARRPPLAPGFDAVLVDAPCSGLGTLRQHPELKWRRSPDDLPRLARLQREILAGVAPLVCAGGLLVYSVCTHTREETSEVVAELLAAEPRFVVEPVAPPLGDRAGFLRTWPHTHGLDGFFAARLRARR